MSTAGYSTLMSVYLTTVGLCQYI